MREMAIFYANYAKKGDDGYYHVIPSMEPERWGFYGGEREAGTPHATAEAKTDLSHGGSRLPRTPMGSTPATGT